MQKFVIQILLFYLIGSGLRIFAQEPDVAIKLNFTGNNFGTEGNTVLTLGLHAEATVGPPEDQFDKVANRSPLPQFSNTFFLLEDSSRILRTDVKPFDNRLTWNLRIEFGNPSPVGTSVTMNWKDDSDNNPFANLTDYPVVVLVDNTEFIDMTTRTEYEFVSMQPNESRDVFIRLRRSNTDPTANTDAHSVLTDTTTPKPIDVLLNDTDVDNDQLFIVDIPTDKQPGKGMARIITDETDENKTKIEYTPNPDATGNDSFDYIMSDGVSTARATVDVTITDIFFKRQHNATIVAGESFLVNVDISYNRPNATPRITLTETLPASYSIPSGTGPGGLAITGGVPPNLVETSGNTVEFIWDASLPGNAPPPADFAFQYRLIGDENDRDERTIRGSIQLDAIADEFTLPTSFTPIDAVFHPADTDGNNRISDAEKNIFFARPTLIVKKGFERCGNEINGFPYTLDSNNLKFIPCPDTGLDCSACISDEIHPADIDGNQRINDAEKNKLFARPTLIVTQGFERCGNLTTGYPYKFEGNNFIPDATVPCD